MYEFEVFFKDKKSIKLYCEDIQYGIGVIEGTPRERGIANVDHYVVRHESEVEMPRADLPDDWEAA